MSKSRSSSSSNSDSKHEEAEIARMRTTARSLWVTRVGVVRKGTRVKSSEENVA
jgi:hypothetical protein